MNIHGRRKRNTTQSELHTANGQKPLGYAA